MRLIAIACALAVAGCGGSEVKGLSAEDVALLKTISARLSALESKANNLEEKASKLRLDHTLARLSGPQEVVVFDPQDDQAYQPVKAPAGPVLVMLEKVEPYLDGFVVSMRIGNPSSAAYAGLAGKVRWGRKYDAQKDEVYNKLEEKDIDLKDVLPSGSWTIVKFNIAPAKPEEVRRIVFAPTFNQLRLRSP